MNTAVDLDAYPDDIARKQAEQLLDAETFRFDLDDAIGGAVQTAYFTGVTAVPRRPQQARRDPRSDRGCEGIAVGARRRACEDQAPPGRLLAARECATASQ